jgi:hypothetical protein
MGTGAPRQTSADPSLAARPRSLPTALESRPTLARELLYPVGYAIDLLVRQVTARDRHEATAHCAEVADELPIDQAFSRIRRVDDQATFGVSSRRHVDVRRGFFRSYGEITERRVWTVMAGATTASRDEDQCHSVAVLPIGHATRTVTASGWSTIHAGITPLARIAASRGATAVSRFTRSASIARSGGASATARAGSRHANPIGIVRGVAARNSCQHQTHAGDERHPVTPVRQVATHRHVLAPCEHSCNEPSRNSFSPPVRLIGHRLRSAGPRVPPAPAAPPGFRDSHRCPPWITKYSA